MCGNDVTMMDVILFNELSQILCIYALFAKSSGADKEDNLGNQEEDYDSDAELLLIKEYKNLTRWYKHKMQVGDSVHLALKKYDHKMRTII